MFVTCIDTQFPCLKNMKHLSFIGFLSIYVFFIIDPDPLIPKSLFLYGPYVGFYQELHPFLMKWLHTLT